MLPFPQVPPDEQGEYEEQEVPTFFDPERWDPTGDEEEDEEE